MIIMLTRTPESVTTVAMYITVHIVGRFIWLSARKGLLQEFCVSLTNQSKWKNIECVVNLYTAIPFGFNQSYYCFYCLNIYDDFKALYRHTRLMHPIFNSEIASLMSDELKNSVKVNVANLACKLC